VVLDSERKSQQIPNKQETLKVSKPNHSRKGSETAAGIYDSAQVNIEITSSPTQSRKSKTRKNGRDYATNVDVTPQYPLSMPNDSDSDEDLAIKIPYMRRVIV
jgi:hypothetical protein